MSKLRFHVFSVVIVADSIETAQLLPDQRHMHIHCHMRKLVNRFMRSQRKTVLNTHGKCMPDNAMKDIEALTDALVDTRWLDRFTRTRTHTDGRARGMLAATAAECVTRVWLLGCERVFELWCIS